MRRHTTVRRRRFAAVAMLAAVTGLALHGIGASAQAPSNATLPDFASGAPYQDSMPKQFGYQVVSGGYQAGDPLLFHFRFNGANGDRTHGVNFAVQSPDDATLDVTIIELPSAAAPVTGCLGLNNHVNSVVADPYAQSIRVVPQKAETAGQALLFCFSGVASFPMTAGSGYSIDYTEPGGTVSAPYTVLSAATGATTSEVVNINDGPTDVTDVGLGGSQPLAVYGVSYRVTVHAAANSTYLFGALADDAVNFRRDQGATATVTGTSNPTIPGTCTPGATSVCTDSNGTATATLTVNSDNANPDYVIVSGALQGSQAKTEAEASAVSVTVGPAGASLSAPPPPTPTPAGTPGPTSASTFDPACTGNMFGSQGLGSREVFDEFSHVLLPAALTECPQLGHLINYLGVTDSVGLQAVLVQAPSPYAFAGTDRALSSSEETMYAPGGANTISQIPISVEPVVVTYNLDASGCQVQNLNLRSTVLSLILMGQINTWNNKLLVQDNPGLSGCSLPILVAHDIGVTSSILKDYLSKRNPQWAAYRQPQLSQAWPGSSPVSCTANGSGPMALCVAGRPGTIGYGFYRAVADAGLPIAQVDSPTGFWDDKNSVLEGCTAAAGTSAAPNPFALMPATANGDWGNTSLTDTAEPGAYPICTFDFVVAATGCRYSHSIINYRGLAAFLDAILSDYAQQRLASAGYAALPASIQSFSTSGVGSLTCP